MTNEAQRSEESDSTVGLCVTITDEMVDAFIAFSRKASYLNHPEVQYFGTVNGDSEEMWNRRFVRAAMNTALTHNAEVRGCAHHETLKEQ